MMIKNLKLKIIDISKENRREKFAHAIGAIARALEIPTTLQVQPVTPEGDDNREKPIPIVQELIDGMVADYKAVLDGLMQGIGKGVLGEMIKAQTKFVVPAGVVYNPKTGKPVPRESWKKLNRAIDSYLSKTTNNMDEVYATKSMAVGAITNRLEKQGKNVVTLTMNDIKEDLPKNFKMVEIQKKFELDPDVMKTIYYRVDNLATYITDINNDVRSDINRILLEGIQQEKSNSDIARDLFESYESWNRDWDRIARTETQDSVSDGHMITEITDTPDEAERIYMIGMGAANACPTCQRDIVGKVVRLLRKPPEGGSEKIDDPFTDTAIWPGKRSMGHTNKEIWVAITRHPHCGCRWTRHYPEGPSVV